MKPHRITMIVLKKTAYSESSLIVSGITAESGRVDLLFKGGRKISAGKTPMVDLFRELNVDAADVDKGLRPAYSAELSTSFDGISDIYANYLAACEISEFVLRNSQPGVPCPGVYDVLREVFARLANGPLDAPAATMVKLVYLEEHGLLHTPEDPGKSRILQWVLDSARKGGYGFPRMSESYLKRFCEWIDATCVSSGLA
ncbi:MAG: recombination protein O N-terminal domain-containing protein [Victivallales bacterium]|nr:recombination protein O N-terminal domain-containing protein [Victivallales bacterium]